MRLFRLLRYRLSKAESVGALFMQAREVAEDTGSHQYPVLFYLADYVGSGMPGSISAVARIIKRFPTLAQFATGAGTDFRLPPRSLSNLPAPWVEANPGARGGGVDAEVLGSIAQGVPRSFPLVYAAFVFDRIDWFGTGEEIAPPAVGQRPLSALAAQGYLSPSIGIVRLSDGERSWCELSTTVEIALPAPDAHRLPPLNPVVRAHVDQLGKVHLENLVAAPSDEERASVALAEQQARTLVEEVRANVTGPLAGVPLPFELPPSPEPGIFPGPLSLKPAALATFKRRGYRHDSKRSRHGSCVLVKRTPGGNWISLDLGLGGWGTAILFTLTIRGPLWAHGMGVHVERGQRNPPRALADQETLDRATANAGAVIDYLEAALFRKLDGIYGPAPAWFVYEQ